jgi:hypothetical protein
MMTVLYALALIAVLALLALAFGALAGWCFDVALDEHADADALAHRVRAAITGRCARCHAPREQDDLTYVAGLGYVCDGGCEGRAA